MRWLGSITINRGRGKLEDRQPPISAVTAEIGKMPLPIVHGDGKDVKMPVAY